MQTNNYTKVNKSLESLSSGTSLNKSSTDAASLAISDEMLALIAGSSQSIQNANDSIGLMQVADGALSGIEDNMKRVETLTIKASNDTLNADDRAIIQTEIDGLLQSSDNIATSTKYNGINLLDGTGGSNGDGTFTTQLGANAGETSSITIRNASSSSLVGSIDVTTADGRDAAFKSLESASESLSSMRSDLGSSQNQLMSSIRNTNVGQVNTASAASQLSDVDFAQESANFSKENLMSQIGAFSQSQVNASVARTATLLG
jgi:flagellin